MRECHATCLDLAQGDENTCFVWPHYNLTPYSLSLNVAICTGLVSQVVMGFELICLNMGDELLTVSIFF